MNAQGLPDFIIIGGMKCGTTATWKQLKTHPQLCGARIKETNFFSSEYLVKDIEWYKTQYEEPQKIKFEASPSYTSVVYNDVAAARIKAVVPDVKLIYLIRHPVQRAVSSVRHFVRVNRLSPWNVRQPQFWRKHAIASVSIATSMYFRMLSPYLEHFDLEDILILRHEDLLREPAQTYNRMLQFAGLDDYFSPDQEFLTANVSSEARRVIWPQAHWRLKKLHERKLLPPVHHLLEEQSKKITLSSEQRAYIWREVEGDLRQLEALTGQDFQYAMTQS